MNLVLGPTRYVQSSFTAVISRQPAIESRANEIFEYLEKFYFFPQSLRVPEGFEPDFPRLLFNSQHAFSQIAVSEVSIVLNVRYSPDWQTDISLGQNYIQERIEPIFEIIDHLDTRAHVSGCTNVARLDAEDENSLLSNMAEVFVDGLPRQCLNELSIRVSNVVEERFFSNLTVATYRTWQTGATPAGMVRYRQKDAVSRGVEITGDFNDRYAFNEEAHYHSTHQVASEVVSRGIDDMRNAIAIVEGQEWT